MKFKLKRIDWYIIKQFLGTYIFAIALIIAISVVFDINEKIDKFLSPDVPLKAIVFDYYMNFIPYFANLFSPLFTFIAVIFFTSKLADNSEVIAMLASGMSFRRLMLPYAISAGIIALSTFVLNAYIIPPANATRIDFQNKYIKNKKVKALARKSALAYKAQNNAIIVVEDFNFEAPKTKDFVAMTKNLKVSDKKLLVVLPEANKNVYLSARNVKGANVQTISGLNTYRVLDAGVVVFAESALSAIDNILM